MKTIDPHMASCGFPPRNPRSHKGDYGHALLCAGSYGMLGAAVLAARACLRGGIGKLTMLIPEAGYVVMQTAVPEAMVTTDPDRTCLTTVPDLTPYDAMAVGPGLGRDARTIAFTGRLLAEARRLGIPTVADADALNHLAADAALLAALPAETILTPHQGEFKRLTTGWMQSPGANPDAQTVAFETTAPEALRTLQIQCAVAWQATVVLKGHRTCIASPDGACHENPTGNAGMATAGSGDVLTGLTLAVLARLACIRRRTGTKFPDPAVCGFTSLTELAACAACFTHGLAGDLAARETGETSLTAGDIISHLGQAITSITS